MEKSHPVIVMKMRRKTGTRYRIFPGCFVLGSEAGVGAGEPLELIDELIVIVVDDVELSDIDEDDADDVVATDVVVFESALTFAEDVTSASPSSPPVVGSTTSPGGPMRKGEVSRTMTAARTPAIGLRRGRASATITARPIFWVKRNPRMGEALSR